MSEGIIGAIIGAAIALMGTVITGFVALVTWTRSQKYQILRDERDRLEKKFEIYLEYYATALKENSIDGRMAATFEYEFPEEVRNEFQETIKNKILSSEDPSEKKQAYFRMAYAMSKSIFDYNLEIRRTNKFIDKEFAQDLALQIIRSGILRW